VFHDQHAARLEIIWRPGNNNLERFETACPGA
jgi:hypothetical protein